MKQHVVSEQSESASKNAVAVTTSESEDSEFASLGASLAEIRKLKYVKGYIMRSNRSALVDLPEPDNISRYALLSYQMHESGLEIAKQLDVAEVESALAEGKKLKVLLMKLGQNKISVFMEKSADHLCIIKRILM